MCHQEHILPWWYTHNHKLKTLPAADLQADNDTDPLDEMLSGDAQYTTDGSLVFNSYND